MFDHQLFLGFLISSECASLLNQIPFEVRSLFIQNHPHYLTQVHKDGLSYLGKYLESPVELNTIEMVKENIYSLLHRLIEDFPFENTPLILFAIESNP